MRLRPRTSRISVSPRCNLDFMSSLAEAFAQDAGHDLVRGVARQRVDELDAARLLEAGEALAGELGERGGVEAGAGARDDRPP